MAKEDAMRTWASRHRAERYERVLAIEAGQVVCPRRGIVDLERCWGCPAYQGLSAGRIEGLVCSTDSALGTSVGSWLPSGSGNTEP
jgi:hypothetical protein